MSEAEQIERLERVLVILIAHLAVELGRENAAKLIRMLEES